MSHEKREGRAKTRKPEEWIKLGKELTQKNVISGAIECFDYALILEPNSIDAMLGKLSALEKDDGHKAVLKLCDKILLLDPKCIYAWNFKGSACFGLKQSDDAIRCFKKTLELDPKNTHAMNELFRIYLGRDENKLAREWIEKALKLEPKTPCYLYNSGILYERMNMYTEAVVQYASALINDQHYSSSWAALKKLVNRIPLLEEKNQGLENAIQQLKKELTGQKKIAQTSIAEKEKQLSTQHEQIKELLAENDRLKVELEEQRKKIEQLSKPGTPGLTGPGSPRFWQVQKDKDEAGDSKQQGADSVEKQVAAVELNAADNKHQEVEPSLVETRIQEIEKNITDATKVTSPRGVK